MIAIINRGPTESADPYDTGSERNYTVQINREPVLVGFQHERRDGLAACLRAAADALDKVKPSPQP